MFYKNKTNQKNKSENNGFLRAITTILVALMIAFIGIMITVEVKAQLIF